MSKKPLRKIHRFGPSGRFTRKQIREAIEHVRKLRDQGDPGQAAERFVATGRSAIHDAQPVHR